MGWRRMRRSGWDEVGKAMSSCVDGSRITQGGNQRVMVELRADFQSEFPLKAAPETTECVYCIWDVIPENDATEGKEASKRAIGKLNSAWANGALSWEPLGDSGEQAGESAQ